MMLSTIFALDLWCSICCNHPSIQFRAMRFIICNPSKKFLSCFEILIIINFITTKPFFKNSHEIPMILNIVTLYKIVNIFLIISSTSRLIYLWEYSNPFSVQHSPFFIQFQEKRSRFFAINTFFFISKFLDVQRIYHFSFSLDRNIFVKKATTSFSDKFQDEPGRWIIQHWLIQILISLQVF